MARRVLKGVCQLMLLSAQNKVRAGAVAVGQVAGELGGQRSPPGAAKLRNDNLLLQRRTLDSPV